MKSRREYQERKIMKSLRDNMDKAKAYLDDDDKMEALFKDFEEKLALIPKIGHRASDFPVMMSMIRAYSKKQYTDVSISTILLSVAVLLYVVNPFDLILDYMIGAGQLDDAAALLLVLQAIHMDLEKYKKWQKENGKR